MSDPTWDFLPHLPIFHIAQSNTGSKLAEANLDNRQYLILLYFEEMLKIVCELITAIDLLFLVSSIDLNEFKYDKRRIEHFIFWLIIGERDAEKVKVHDNVLSKQDEAPSLA